MSKESLLSVLVFYPIFFFLVATIHQFIRRKMKIEKEESTKEYVKNIKESYKQWKECTKKKSDDK